MRHFTATVAAIALLSTLLPPGTAAQSLLHRTDVPQVAGATNETRGGCARDVLPRAEADMTGARADEAERLQAKYEEEPGFLAVVFGGGSFWVVVDSVSSGDWTETLPSDGIRIVTSCVDARLIDSANAVMAEAAYSPGGYSSVAYIPSTDSVYVTSTLATEFVAAAIDDRVATTWGSPGATANYGAADLRIDTSTSSAGRLGRGNDTSPFWGGARIRLASGSCSSGFYINSATNGTVMVTAGHCGPNGDTVRNGDNSLVVGTLEGRSFPDPDLVVIDGQNYFARSYSANDQTTSKAISGAAAPATGVTYCQMGYVSLHLCSTYSSLNAQFCDAGGCTSSLALTSRECSIGPLAQPGDSGGGVYREISGALGARGVVIAGGPIGTGAQCARWDHRWPTIQGRYNATIVTS